MSVQNIQSIETSAELPVELLYNQSVTGFLQTHAELSKLPQDKNDPLQPAEATLRNLGVEVDNDFSMLVMGAMGHIGMDMGMHALGLPTTGALSTGLDVASSFLMGLAEERSNNHKADLKNGLAAPKKGATSMFKTSSFRKAEPKAPPAAANTAIMKKAMERKQRLALRKSANKRKQLKSVLEKHMENIKELQAFRSCGVKYAHRVTVPNGDTGENESYLVAAKEKPQMALSVKGKTYEKPMDLTMGRPSFGAPRLGMCA